MIIRNQDCNPCDFVGTFDLCEVAPLPFFATSDGYVDINLSQGGRVVQRITQYANTGDQIVLPLQAVSLLGEIVVHVGGKCFTLNVHAKTITQ